MIHPEDPKVIGRPPSNLEGYAQRASHSGVADVAAVETGHARMSDHAYVVAPRHRWAVGRRATGVSPPAILAWRVKEARVLLTHGLSTMSHQRVMHAIG